MKRHRWWITVPLVAFAALLLILSSCTPAWFPDNNTFLSVGPTGEVFLHKIDTKSTTRLSGFGVSAGQRGVAVSPDGKTIAVCTMIVTTVPASTKIEVAAFDATGKLESKSTHDFLPVDPGAKPEMGAPGMLNVFWSPDSKQLVGFSGAAKSAFSWNHETKTLTAYPESMPISRLLAGEAGWIHSFYPCLPDGTGFLTMFKGKPYVQKWDAKKRILITPVDSAKEFDFKKVTGGDDKFGLWLPPYWKGASFVSPLGEDELTIDTAKNEFRIVKSKDLAELNAFGIENDFVILHRFPNGSTLGLTQEGSKSNLMFYGAMHKTKKEIATSGKESGATFSLLPSPNRERILLTSFGDAFQTRVFNDNGDLDFEYDKYTKVK